MMKILFILNYERLYGANRVLLTLLEYLQGKGYSVSVLLPSNGDMAVELEKRGISHKIIPYYSSFLYIKKTIKFIAYPILLCLNLISLPRILTFVKKNNPDIIYSNTSAENIGLFISKKMKIKHISHIHEFMSLDHKAFFIGGKKLKRAFINKSNGVIFVTKSVASFVVGDTFCTKKHEVIYNGLPIPQGYIKSEMVMLPQNYGIVGILASGKRQDVAIKYFNKIACLYPNAKLHIYGDKDGTYKQYLFRLVKKLKLESQVLFHGFEKDTERIYEKLDVLLMFSRSEGFGLVTVEAMLRGVPVIGYDNGGTTELIENGESGYLFKNEMDFMEAVEKIQIFENYKRVRDKARSRAIDMFNPTTYCLKIEDFIKKIMND